MAGISKKDKVTIEVIGGNCEDVTGSASLISFKDKKYLFEFGMIQGKATLLENYRANREMCQKVKPKEISVIMISHVHCDHIGLIPYLYSVNPSIRLIVPKNSTGILKEMWLDSCYIIQRDCEVLSKKYSVTPFYNESDVDLALSHIEEYDCSQIYKLDDNLSIRYTPAGHIFASCQAEVYISGGNYTRKILFTGDLGNTITQNEKFYLDNFKPVTNASIVIGESTYSKRGRSASKKDLEQDKTKLRSVITQFCVDSNNRVLIPTFSLDRCPYVLSLLYDMFGEDETFTVPILLDSPLMNRLLDRYCENVSEEARKKLIEILSWKNVKRIITPEESKDAIASGKSAVILSSSGMLQISRSQKWAASILPHANDCILFMGYCAENTLAYKIKNYSTQKTITIGGKPVKNRCQIVDLHSFSSHMQREQLIDYYKGINCEKLYLVHGNKNDRLELKEDLEAAISECCHTHKVICVNKSTKISL